MRKLAIAVALSTGVMAGNTLAASVNENDMALIFNQPAKEVSVHQKTQYLSNSEMKATEGEWWANVAGGFVGAISGGSAYTVSSGSNWGFGSFGRSVFGGAVAGFVSPITSWPAGSGIGIANGLTSHVDSRFNYSNSWW